MKFSELFPIMRVINLDSRPDRMEESKREFEKFGISPERFSAIAPTDTPNKQANGILGCIRSHLECLKTAKEANSNIFIFEDDIKFVTPFFKNIIESACWQLEGMKWEMFYLGANILKPFRQVTPNLARLTHAQSTHAYGVNKDFLDTLISYISDKRVFPLDLTYSNTVVPFWRCYITAPHMVAVQRDSYSDIEMTVANYESYLEARYTANYIPMEA